MTDYSLWEVILNDDSSTPTRVVDGVVQAVAPTTAEQRLDKKNELKARGTLLMALLDKHQLKFNTHKVSKSLTEAIKKRFGGNKETKKVQKTLLKQQYENFSGSSSESLDQIQDRLQKLISQLEILGESLSQEDINLKFLRSLPTKWRTHTIIWRNKTDMEDQSLDDLFNKLKIYETKVKSSSFTSHTLQNISFVSFQNIDSTNESISAVTSDSAASPKPLASILPNVDNLSNEMDLKWQMAMLTMRAGEYVEARLVVYQQNENVVGEDIKLLKLDVMLRDNALVELRKKFEKAKKERDELKNTLEKIQTSLKNLSKLLASQITDKSGLGYDNQVINSIVFDSDELISSKTDESVPTSPVHDRTSVKPVEHPTPTKKLRKDTPKSRGHKYSCNRKDCFVCKSLNHLIKYCDYYEKKMVQKPAWNHALRVNHQNSARMTHPHSKKHVVPTAVLNRSRLVPLNTARPIIIAVPQTTITRSRPVNHVVTKPQSIIRRPINHRSSPKNSNFHQKVTTVKAKQVNAVQGVKGNWVWKPKWQPQQALKDKGVIDSGCSRHMTGNISYISDFEEINRGYVAFGGNPKGGKITGKGKLDFDDVYFVKELKFNRFSVSQMVLVSKPHNKTPYELLLGRTPSIGFMRSFGCLFTILNTLDPLRKFDGKADEGFLVGYFVISKAFRVFNSRTRIVQETIHIHFLENQPNVAGSGPTWLFDIDTLTQSINYQPDVIGNQPNHNADPHNTDADATFDVKESESEVHVSLSGSDKTKKHDDKTKREAKGKSLVDLSTGVRNLSDEFEDFSSNSTNGVNAASAPVTAVEPNSANNTNSFNVAGPSNNAVSPTFEIGRKSSFVDPSQYPDDSNMPALKEIIYSDDEEDVDVEADFSNLETTPQKRSMARMVKEQGGLTQINDEDFHTCMFACFLSQEEPKRVHQALKDSSWIEAMQEDLLQFKMQKVWVLVDLPKGKRAIGSKWVFRNKKDARGIVVRNKARLVA
uniref:Uncharacterized protein n=1 Tax=Tanacetum cinerariifolium TaxID=118510 RepID=A0A6L2MMT3_TANCI|nr:hypothetical protein [Tanacetum cinerariifolium]